MSLDEPQADDQVEVINGVQVAVEKGLMGYTDGLSLDFNYFRGFVLLGMEGC